MYNNEGYGGSATRGYSRLNAPHTRVTARLATYIDSYVRSSDQLKNMKQLHRDILLLKRLYYGEDFLRLLDISKRFYPHILFAIDDSILDSHFYHKKLPSTRISNYTLPRKLELIKKARLFAKEYSLYVVPQFVDEIVSLCFPSYKIQGTFEAYKEMKSMQQEWKTSLLHPDWNVKQYFLYLVNVYASGVCGVLTDKQLQDSQNTVNLTFEFAQFAIRLFYSQLFSLGKQGIKDWSNHLNDIINNNKFPDYSLAWLKLLFVL